jgi:integrase
MPTKIPAFRLHKPSGLAVATFNGRDVYFGAFDSAESREKYERALVEWLSNSLRLPRDGHPTEMTVAELLAAYLRYAKAYYAVDDQPTSEYGCIKSAIRPLRELYSRVPVTQFGPLALKVVRERLIKRGLCRTNINQSVHRIRRMFRWGVENEFVAPAVLQALQAVAPLRRGRTTAPESKEIRAVPDNLVEAVLPCVAPQVAAMIQLQRLSGMRSGEVVIMRPCDIDRSSDVWIYTPRVHKTMLQGHKRDIFIGPIAQRILEPWLNRPASCYCFSPLEAEAARSRDRRRARRSPMTPSHAKRHAKPHPQRAKRERYDRDSYRRAIEYGIKKAGVAHWHPHQLRHTCGTRIRGRYGLDAAQVVLGHRTAAVTEIYAEADREKALAAMAASG